MVCVDQVAASGGYMMAAVADEIVISPFAVLGSVGVIATVPNFSERMEREGVVVEDVTAGKYKRTMTPYKKTTEEDREKTQEDINTIFNQFKQHLKTSRPALDIESIATGETWLGQEALDRNLCDRLCTADDVLIEYMKEGACVYSITYTPRKPKKESISIDFTDNHEAGVRDNNNATYSVMGRVMKSVQDRLIESFFVWLQQKVMKELNHNISTNTNSISNQLSQSSSPPMSKFMAIDNNPSSNSR